MALNIVAKFEEKLTFAFKNDIRNLGSFARALKSLKIGTLWDSFVQS